MYLSQDRVTRSDKVAVKDKKMVAISEVISASLGRRVQLPEPVKITFKHIMYDVLYEKSPEVTPVCVYWDFDLHGWSDEGCRLISTSEKSSECECEHLTNFGLLVDDRVPVSLGADEPTKTSSNLHVIEIVTYVAIAISVLFVVIILMRVRVTNFCIYGRLGNLKIFGATAPFICNVSLICQPLKFFLTQKKSLRKLLKISFFLRFLFFVGKWKHDTRFITRFI